MLLDLFKLPVVELFQMLSMICLYFHMGKCAYQYILSDVWLNVIQFYHIMLFEIFKYINIMLNC